MDIIGKVKVESFLRVEDLEVGEVFIFLDSDVILMKCGNGQFDFIIELATGNEIDNEDKAYINRPVRRIKAKLFIED